MSDSHIVVENEWNPTLNHKVISIMEQPDGNWKGWMFKNDKLHEIREADPETVLKRLLVSP